jgi:hypothetical protein
VPVRPAGFGDRLPEPFLGFLHQPTADREELRELHRQLTAQGCGVQAAAGFQCAGQLWEVLGLGDKLLGDPGIGFALDPFPGPLACLSLQLLAHPSWVVDQYAVAPRPDREQRLLRAQHPAA